MDQVSETRLKEVHPLLAEKIRHMADLLAQQGVTIRVTQGLRTYDDQKKLYDQGRSVPGLIVTNAPAGSSWHNFGLAVDVVPMIETGPDWNLEHPVWARIISVGTSVGLASGAAWRTFPDWPHFQLTGNLPTYPTPAIRNTLITDGIPAVWQKTGYTIVTRETTNTSVG